MILIPQILTRCHDIMLSFGLFNTLNNNIHSLLIIFVKHCEEEKKKLVIYHITLFLHI